LSRSRRGVRGGTVMGRQAFVHVIWFAGERTGAAEGVASNP
jgi:hypothetical protein